MFKKFKPTWMIDAIYNLDVASLRAHKIQGVLTDLDNTLIAWNNPEGTEELKNWLAEMKQAKIHVIVVSNNKESRISKAVAPFEVEFISRAMKPFARGINEAQQRLNLPKEALLMVGDQLMTDIRGGNAAGVKTVLVKPIVKTDAWNTRINRFMEKFVMQHLLRRHPDMIWKEKIND